MKILVTGSYATGKTSFCQLLAGACAANNITAACPDEVARSFRLPLNASQDGEISALLLGMQISQERHAFSGNMVLICDRGVPDIWSHNLASNKAGKGIGNPAISAVCIEWVRTYDLIIQSTACDDIDIPDDGVRNTDKRYRRQLEICHRQAMNHLSLHPNLIFDHTVQSRCAALRGAIAHIREVMISSAS